METIEIYNKQGGWPKISITIEVIESFFIATYTFETQSYGK